MTTRSPDFDVLIVGGGHAGAEAAWAAARLGARTALVTFDRAAIGRMSCNPAIGGIGKGQMVREIDALGGLMGLVTDQTAIQFRMLNRRKGPAVWAPRAQCDREAYAAAVRSRLEACANLEIIAGSVEQLLADSCTARAVGAAFHVAAGPTAPLAAHAAPQSAAHAGSQFAADAAPRSAPGAFAHFPAARQSSTADAEPAERITNGASSAGAIATAALTDVAGPTRRITGVVLGDGRTLRAAAVVITSGTFLRALMHCGETRTPGGRVGEAAAVGLSAALRALGLQLGRLKTGTPPRLARDSIDFDRLEPQHGDASPAAFSFLTERIEQTQIPCWITYTNDATHELIRANLHRAPMYSGQIESRGPRYCPSIEDKVVRFADKPRHQLFLEPEGRDSDRIYVNGISTSLPQDVQARIIAGIDGLERARVLQWGYAVEYDFAPPEQIDAALMVRRVAGLFLAGQINGTSGYEEAAGQGLLAGVNAARFVRGLPPVILRRDQAYVGVMIDDLVTRGVTEPYRMFTSRAEHRMHLRYDNADQRLTPLGREIGLVCDARWTRFAQRAGRIAELLDLFGRLRVEGRTIGEWLRRPDEEDGARFVSLLPELRGYFAQADVWGSALVQIKYAGYIERQDRMIEHARSLESREIPPDFDYAGVRQLRREALERWSAVRPRSVGQAARVSGVHPTDVTLLLLALRDASTQAAETE